MNLRASSLSLVLAVVSVGGVSRAQKGGGSSTSSQSQSGSSGGGGSSGSLPGLTYPREDWPALQLPDTTDRIVMCFQLKRSESYTQPFVLEPAAHLAVRCYRPGRQDAPDLNETDPRGQDTCRKSQAAGTTWDPCTTIDKDHPLRAGQTLVIAIDVNALGRTESNDLARIQMLNINVTNQQGQPFDPTLLRPNATAPTFNFDGSGSKHIDQGVYYLTWPVQVGADVVPTVAVNIVYVPPMPGDIYRTDTRYAQGAIVLSKPNHHYYAATVSSPSSGPPANVPAPIPDGHQQWIDIGISASSGASARPWSPTTRFAPGDVTFDPKTGHYFQAQTAGDPGAMLPAFVVDQSDDWRDLGTTALSSLSTGPTPDQTVNLLTLALPQAHSISYYGLAAGLVYSNLQSHSFGLVPDPADPTGKSVRGTVVSSTHIVDPVLFLTYYPHGIDTERAWHLEDLCPGLSAGISFASPINNFYFGLSFEVRRNLQLVGGLTVARITELAAMQLGTSSVTTAQRFETSVFVGMSFNSSGFIQSLFSGAGRSGSS